MEHLSPQEIVAALDRYIVGQAAAKRAAAIAIRNRWRRSQLPAEIRDEVTPANMLLIGPTGVGKTEVARRLAGLVGAPFVKVEATKYTEVGYHGRDVESMVRDLVELAVHLVREEQTEIVREEAGQRTEERLLDILIPAAPDERALVGEGVEASGASERRMRNREKLRSQLRSGALEERIVEVRVETKAAPIGMMATLGGDAMDPDIQSFMDRLVPPQQKTRAVAVKEARDILFAQQCEALIDREKVTEAALERAQQSGIIFIDEIDKLAAPGQQHGPDVSRQGVQRDLLPIIEGSTVNTRYGPVRTDHILFIAAGAFHATKPSELMPELQGRLPIRVELEALTRDDFVRILTEPQNALIKQHVALLGTEGVFLEFSEDSIAALADTAFRVNQATENIGARRLVTVMEKLLADISFNAPALKGQTVRIDAALVRERLGALAKDEDLARFIL